MFTIDTSTYSLINISCVCIHGFFQFFGVELVALFNEMICTSLPPVDLVLDQAESSGYWGVTSIYYFRTWRTTAEEGMNQCGKMQTGEECHANVCKKQLGLLVRLIDLYIIFVTCHKPYRKHVFCQPDLVFETRQQWLINLRSRVILS